MRCEECPFHFVCVMGRLGGKEGTRSLCPSCGKFELLDEKNEACAEIIIRVYKFHCEQRVATPQVRNQYRRCVTRSVPRNAHRIMETEIQDPVDDRRLKIAECLECSKSPLRNIAHVRIIDLDTDWEDDERRRRHVFRLRTSRDD
jgi:hypothetical protein